MPPTQRNTPDAPAAAAKPERGHVRRDGGRDTLQLPETAGGRIVVTDMTQLEVVPSSGYTVEEGKVVRRGGVWANGKDRWLVEYDRA